MNLIRLSIILLSVTTVTPGAFCQQDTLNEMDTLINFHQFKTCKSSAETFFIIPVPKEFVSSSTLSKVDFKEELSKPSILKVSGNILYDVNYRSRIDTPYAESNVYQHTIQTRLDFLYKEKYPFRLYLTTRFSNSSLFRKYTDLNFQFSPAEFRQIAKSRVLESITALMANRLKVLDSIKREIALYELQIEALRKQENPDATAQKIIEDRERELYFKAKTIAGSEGLGRGSENPDFGNRLGSMKPRNRFLDSLNYRKEGGWVSVNDPGEPDERQMDPLYQKKAEMDSLQQQLDRTERLYKSLKSGYEANLSDIRKQVEGAKDLNTLSQKLRQLGFSDTLLPKGYKTLASIQSVGIGRSTADYSELSVRNISITGFQMEYNPRYYYAVAAGKVDYRFRDYIIPSQTRSNQFLALVRFGKGTRSGNHIFITYYTGRRQFFNASTTTQSGVHLPSYNLAGVTVEGIYNVTKNIQFIAEAAKSTVPYYSLDSLQKSSWLRSVTRFNDRRNEAYSAKLLTYLPKSKTRFSANIRYTGANFQSFSTFTSGASQLRWKGRLEQPFFKRHLTVISSLEQNDYVNPFVNLAYKSTAVLASFQANLRFKKWPVISMGYYPSFQLVKTGDDQYSESRYYTMMASAGYYYKTGKAQASSYLVYSRFYNDLSDSGFVYYNSKNLLLTQSLNYSKCSYTVNATANINTDHSIYGLESGVQYSLYKFLSVGGGVKIVKHSLLSYADLGYNGNLTLKVPRLGELQVMMDKGFIPGMNRQLVENKMGRLIYYKTF